MSRLMALLVLMVALTGCGDRSGPCNDYDPAGACANSHSQNYESR